MLPKTSLVCMSRSGHRAVIQWMKRTYEKVKNVEAKNWEFSRRKIGDGHTTLLLRDYPNWAASIASYFPHHFGFDTFVDKWITHANAAHTVPTILFHEWVEAGNGEGIEIFGESPNEALKNKTSDGPGNVLTRYKQMAGHPVYERLMQRTDAIEASERVFA